MRGGSYFVSTNLLLWRFFLSMFDDGCCNNTAPFKYLHPARGLILRLSKGHATVVRQVHHYNTPGVPTSGSFREELPTRTFTQPGAMRQPFAESDQ